MHLAFVAHPLNPQWFYVTLIAVPAFALLPLFSRKVRWYLVGTIWLSVMVSTIIMWLLSYSYRGELWLSSYEIINPGEVPESINVPGWFDVRYQWGASQYIAMTGRGGIALFHEDSLTGLPAIMAKERQPSGKGMKYASEWEALKPTDGYPRVQGRGSVKYLWQAWGLEMANWERSHSTRYSHGHNYVRGIVLPFWLLAALWGLLLPLLAKIYWVMDGRPQYRRRHDMCLRCGYRLHGLSEPRRCPECGTEPKITRTRSYLGHAFNRLLKSCREGLAHVGRARS